MTLEPAAQDFADATAKPPYLYELEPDAARKVLDDVQAAPIDKPDVDEKWIVVPAEVGEVAVRIVRPLDSTRPLPALHRFMADRAGAKGVREVAGGSHALSVSEPGAVTASILEARYAIGA